MKKPKLIIAGPGAGKTSNMVEKILSVLPSLQPYRILAVITYTNAATDLIKTKLCSKIPIQNNIFIGTTYSFFDRFIIKPYGHTFFNIHRDKIFMEIDLDDHVRSLGIDSKDYRAINWARSSSLERLLRQGFIPISEIGRISAKIISDNKKVREVLGNRLQYLFIDEFQDIDSWQYKVFDELRKERKTEIFAVGDPEQYISGYTYIKSTAKKPKYKDLPIFKFNAEREDKLENYRSYKEITDFTNNFHSSIKQVSFLGSCSESKVVFFGKTNIESIVSSYREIISTCQFQSKERLKKYYYLSYENQLFQDLSTKYNLVSISDGNNYSRPPFILCQQLLSSCTGLSEKKILETYNISRLTFREYCVRLLQKIKNQQIKTEEEFFQFVNGELAFSVTEVVEINFGRSINEISRSFSYLTQTNELHQYSSIHKAKGLEADAVLAVAKTRSELESWLTTDKQKRFDDKGDRCRIGYVAFTRAKQILCFACLQKINQVLEEKIRSLGVDIYV